MPWKTKRLQSRRMSWTALDLQSSQSNETSFSVSCRLSAVALCAVFQGYRPVQLQNCV